MNNTEELKEPLAKRKVGEIVASDYRTAAVFEKHGIDFCCGGNDTLESVCENRQVNYKDLEKELLHARESKTAGENPDYGVMPLGELIDYIINVHHKFINDHGPVLRNYARKAAEVHGKSDDSIIAVEVLLKRLLGELTHHMFKEENILFPHIKNLASGRKEGQARFASVEMPIRMMEHEHEHASGILRAIRELSGNYTPPPRACNTHKALLWGIQELEADLHKHIHLENNILFPRAMELENREE